MEIGNSNTCPGVIPQTSWSNWTWISFSFNLFKKHFTKGRWKNKTC